MTAGGVGGAGKAAAMVVGFDLILGMRLFRKEPSVAHAKRGAQADGLDALLAAHVERIGKRPREGYPVQSCVRYVARSHVFPGREPPSPISLDTAPGFALGIAPVSRLYTLPGVLPSKCPRCRVAEPYHDASRHRKRHCRSAQPAPVRSSS